MKKVFVLGGSFNPPALHHETIVRELIAVLDSKDELLVIPCGDRPDKRTTGSVAPMHRANLARLAFGKFDRVMLDLSDLDHDEFTRTADLNDRLRAQYQDYEIILVVGQDLIEGGATGASEIHRVWHRDEELWNDASFLVLTRGDKVPDRDDLPPHSHVLQISAPGSSSEVRSLIRENRDVRSLISPKVHEYIVHHRLYMER